MKSAPSIASLKSLITGLALISSIPVPAQVLNCWQTISDALGAITHTAISPDGFHAYVTAFEDNGIAVYQRDTATGRLSFAEALFDNGLDGSGQALTGLNQPRRTAISPDGQFVYVACAGNDNAINVFQRDPGSGSLTLVEVIRDGGTDQTGNTVDGLEGVRALTISGDGRQLFAAGTYEQSVAVFSRDANSGRLTFVEALKDAYPDSEGQTVDGLRNAMDLVLSLDDNYLYVTSPGDNSFFSRQDNALAVFKRNSATNHLTFVQVLKDGGTDPDNQPVDGLNYSPGIAISPDGAHIYIASKLDDAVAVFRRDTQTGMLRFVQVIKDNQLDAAGKTVTGLNAAGGVAVSVDGRYVYVLSDSEDDLLVFSRNSTTGQLSLVQSFQDGGTDAANNKVDGLGGAAKLVSSPDGRYVYVTGSSSGKVAVFRQLTTPGMVYMVQPGIWASISSDLENGFAAVDDTLYEYMNNDNLPDDWGLRLHARLEAAKTKLHQSEPSLAVNLLRAMYRQITAFQRGNILRADLAKDLQDQLNALIAAIGNS